MHGRKNIESLNNTGPCLVNGKFSLCQFLGAFIQFRKATPSFAIFVSPSVRPSVMLYLLLLNSVQPM